MVADGAFSHKINSEILLNGRILPIGGSSLGKVCTKNGLPIVFSNLTWKGLGVYFHARVQFFLPNALYLPTKQPWGA